MIAASLLSTTPASDKTVCWRIPGTPRAVSQVAKSCTLADQIPPTVQFPRHGNLSTDGV